jgi:ApeA N-terminal domain 1
MTMKHFEASGLWYPADDPTNAVGGTLKFDDKGLKLFLLGSFRQGWSPDVERYSIIHGVVGGSPYGAFVTLIDSFVTGQQFNMVGATSESIRCHAAMVGNCHLPEEARHYELVELDFSYLTEWVGLTGLKLDWMPADRRTCVVTYHKPDSVKFTFGDKTLTLAFTFNASKEAHKTSLSESARLVVEPVGDLTPETLIQYDIRTLQNLLSFATDTPNEIEEIAYSAETGERGITPQLNLIYDPVFKLKERQSDLHVFDMLFTFGDTQSIGMNVFQNWLDFSRKHKAFCELYFGYIYSKPKYLDDRFARVVTAFTLLCSSLGEASPKAGLFLGAVEAAVKAHFPEEERDYLNHLIPSWSKVDMSICLLSLLKENSDLMSQVIGDFSDFIRAVSDTLGFVERRVEGVRPPLKGSSLLYSIKKIDMLIKIVILNELGFDQDLVKTLVGRNSQLSHLKTV